MRLKPFVWSAALAGAAMVTAAAVAQDVPTPPPAGVKPVPRRTTPSEVRPAAPEQSPAQTAEPTEQPQADKLPQLPEHPIRLEDEQNPVPQGGAPVPAAPGPIVGGRVFPGPGMAATRRPVEPQGPVYYYETDPYRFPGNAAMPPGLHIPNSPYVEDLSVAGDHGRYPYYSYRRPWYTPGHMNANVTIVW